MIRSTTVGLLDCRRLVAKAMLCLLPALAMSQAGAAGYTYTTWSTSPDSAVAATDVNDAGTVVGNQLDFNSSAYTAFVYAGGIKTDVPGRGGAISVDLSGITNNGVISGYFYTSVGPLVAHGFTGLGGTFEFFDAPGASQTFVDAGNDLDALVGSYRDADGNESAFLAVPVPEPAAVWLLVAGLAGLVAQRRQLARPAGL